MFAIPTYQQRIRLVAIFVAAAMFFGRNAVAHEGESHAEPQGIPVALSGSDRISVSGHGDIFEVVLKYTPFEPGMDVFLTAYVLDMDTNEPVHGAKLSGTFSIGAASHDETFAEASAGLPGAYEATLKAVGDEKASWLFDVAAGDKSDLVAVDGFRAGGTARLSAAHAEAKQIPMFIELTRTQAGIATAVILVIIAVFIYLTRRRSKPTKESHS